MVFTPLEKSNDKRRIFLTEFIIVLVILSIDQLSKLLVVKFFTPNQSVPIIEDVFHLTLILNRGAAFGIFKNRTFLFIITSIIAVILIFVNLRKNRHNKLYVISLSLILAGALGNLIDRLFFGFVIDFLDFRIWPVFNVADSAITVGAILLAFIILKSKT